MIRPIAALLAALVLASPSVAATAPPMKGMALGLYTDHGAPDQRHDYPAQLRQIAALGADHVSLVVAWTQRDVRSTSIAPNPRTTYPDGRLRLAIRAARRAGLKVLLFPIIDLTIRRPLEWRGTIQPRDIDAWWRSYERFILHYAALAADERVDVFSVGSELVSTEAWQDRWYHLISAVKRRYRGKLLYSANWDHYEPVSFWNRVDYLGVTGYNELTRALDASEGTLAAGWASVRKKLVAFARKVDRPLVFTEVGYTSTDGAAIHPWDYTSRAELDLEEQRRCYAAFVRAWDDEPMLAGVFWWNWFGFGGPRDKSYTPKGKPAERVLRRWYGGR